MPSFPLAFLALTLMAAVTNAFSLSTAFISNALRHNTKAAFKARHSSLNMISSFDQSKKTDTRIFDPEKNIQAYLVKNETSPKLRKNLNGAALVSGLVRSTERPDQTIFDMLNHENFNFEKIYAHVDDVKFAKKRLISRTARYSGLLDRLDFSQASSPGALPTSQQIKDLNITNWIAVVEEDHIKALNEIHDIVHGSQGSQLQNVGILLVNAFELDDKECKKIVDKFKEISESDEWCDYGRATILPFAYHIVAVGELADYAEGSFAYAFEEFGSLYGELPTGIDFSRDLATRIITDMLQCEAGSCKALSFVETVDEKYTEVKLIKGLRQAGFDHAQELEHMLNDGVKNYEAAVANFKKSPGYRGPGYGGPNWWEAPEYADNSIEKSQEDMMKKEKEEEATAKAMEIAKIGIDWAKQEFFKETMAGTTDLKEAEYVDAVWDRAMKEGQIKYRELHGETVDKDAEYADFEEKQRRKEETLLKRAKEELSEILEEEGLIDESFDGKKTD